MTTQIAPQAGYQKKNGVQPPADSLGLGSIVRDYGACELPKTEWLTRLKLMQPRENLTCLPTSTRVLKRVGDIAFAISMMILLAPFLLLVAIAIRLSSPGAIIYRQNRVGLNRRSKKSNDRRQSDDAPPPGQHDRRGLGTDRREACNYGTLFTIYKFRTMRNDAEHGGAQFAAENDPRVTALGRFLRRTRIDELPQLWNILKGDMSLIGPRPERPEFMKELSLEVPNYLDRLGLKPGLTGVAQVVNGYDNEIEGFRRKIGYDLLYLQNCCLVNDLKILLRTVRVVITGEGAM